MIANTLLNSVLVIIVSMVLLWVLSLVKKKSKAAEATVMAI